MWGCKPILFLLTDIGIFSTPSVADIDGDGDMDVLSGSSDGNFYYFENTAGAGNTPVFAVVQLNPFSLTGNGVFSTSSIADIDGDGDMDVLSGDYIGTFYYFENTAGAGNTPVFAVVQLNPFSLTDIGDYSTPSVADIDDDGDMDVLSGDIDGNFSYFENTAGIGNTPVFAVVQTNPFSLTDIGTRSTPSIADIDGDGDMDVLSGDFYGKFYYFKNTAPLACSAVLVETAPTCVGGTDGNIALTPANGTTYSYTWSNGATTQNLTGISATAFTVTMVADGSCTTTEAVTVSPPTISSLSITGSETVISCNGFSDGVAMVTTTGGSTGYTYSWAGATETTNTLSGLVTGTYFVTATDACGSTIDQSMTITEPTAISISTHHNNAISCNGLTDGEAMVTVTGGPATTYSYAWESSSTTDTQSGLSAGVENVTVTSGVCTESYAFTITEPTSISISTHHNNMVSCNGLTDGEAMVTVTDGPTTMYSYAWESGSTTDTQSGLSAGTEMVTVTSGVCSDMYGFTITEPSTITATLSCNATSGSGASDGSSSVSVSGGATPYVYDWGSGTSTNTTLTGLLAGQVDVTVTDNNSCGSNVTCTVIDDPCSTNTVSASSNDPSCNGVSDGDATASLSGGFSTAFTYLWGNGATTASQTGLTGGNYTVTIMDGQSCNGTAMVTITEPNQITATDVETICDGDSVQIGTTYYMVAGTYQKLETALNGCDSIVDVTLTVNSSYLFDETVSSCFGDSAMIFGNYESVSGTYYDSLTTAGTGCDSIYTTILQIGVLPTSQIDSMVICSNDSILLGGAYQDSIGSFHDTLVSVAGCDSIYFVTVLDVEAAMWAGPDTVVSACFDESSIDLFNYLLTDTLELGIWTDDDSTGALTNNIYNATILGLGTYQFTYTVSPELPCVGSSAVVTLSIDICTGIDEINEFGVELYPNPNSGSFIIIQNNSEFTQMIIRDITGRTIQQQSLTRNKVEVELNSSTGVYFIELSNDETRVVKRIILK